jgi:hypothetical protein
MQPFFYALMFGVVGTQRYSQEAVLFPYHFLRCGCSDDSFVRHQSFSLGSDLWLLPFAF